MINQPHTTNTRLLAIAPSTRGFGFAVMEGHEILVDWGVKSFKENKNRQSLAKVKELMDHYQPEIIVLPQETTQPSRRSRRIHTLGASIIRVAKGRRVKIVVFSNEQVKQLLLEDREGNKHAVAETLAKRFPAELGSRLPPERRPWMSEDYRMGIFEAVGLVLCAVME
jgi:RNase H-fold protein (predicted Holliday junction resolvase)